MSEDEAEEVQAPNKLWMEAMNANVRIMVSEMLQEFRRELQPSPEQIMDRKIDSIRQEHKRARARKDQELKAKPPDNTLRSTWRSSQNIPHTPKPKFAFYSGIELFKFSGKRNYLEWEENMDEWFYYNHIPSKERLPHAVKQLTGNAREWWLEEVDDRWYSKKPSITSWRELRKLLRNKYDPRSPNHTAQANTTIKGSAVPEKKPALAPEQMKAMKIQMEQMFSEHLDAYRKELQQNSYQEHNKNQQRSKQESFPRQDKDQPKQSSSVSGKECLGQSLAIQTKLFEQKGELILATNQRQISNSESIDTSNAEQAKVSDQLNKADHNSSLNMVTLLSCPKKAEKGTGEKNERSATHDSLYSLDKAFEQYVFELVAPTDSAPKESIFTSKSPQHLLLGSNIIETHDLIQWHHFITGYGFKYFCFNASISSIMHLFCPMSFQEETGPNGVLTSMRIKEKPPDWQRIHSKLTELQQKTTRQARLNGGRTRRNVELTHDQERAHTRFTQLRENPPDKCRRNSKQRTRGNYLDSQKRMKPDLLSLGTGQNVFKTRCSETREYDAITNPSNYPTQEPIIMQSPCDYPRKHCKKIDLVGNEPNLFVIVSAEEEKRFGLENVKEFRVPCSVFDQMILSFEALTPEKFFHQMGFLFDDCCAYNSSLKVYVSNSVFDMYRTRTEYALFTTWSELDCLLRNLLIEPCKLRNHVLGLNPSEMTLDALGNESMLDHLRRLFVYSKRTFDVVSLVFVKIKERQVKDSRAMTIQVLSNQVDYGPRQQLSYHLKIWNWKYLRKDNLNKGSKTVLTCARREDDQRFKPPDLCQIRHLNLRLFFLIKEKPPDARSIPMTRFCKVGGKFSIQSEFISTNLLYVYTDNLDLRSNPFQVGGDDMRMDEQLEPERGDLEELGLEELKQALELPSGPVTRVNARQFDQAVSTLLIRAKSNLSHMANQTTLVLILAD